jgi:hypothetical protein
VYQQGNTMELMLDNSAKGKAKRDAKAAEAKKQDSKKITRRRSWKENKRSVSSK